MKGEEEVNNFKPLKLEKLATAKYPKLQSSEQKIGSIVDIVHERGRDAPLARIQFDKEYGCLPNFLMAWQWEKKIQIGDNVDFKPKNILALEAIPDGAPYL